MAFMYEEIGQRLKAFRLGSGLSSDEIARRLSISRTALYRFEKGELAKIDTLERLSELLNVSMPTLLGVGIEYIPSAVSYFERIRQLEEKAEHIVTLAGPISFLLASEHFMPALDQVLRESVSDDLPDKKRALSDIDQIMEILRERKQMFVRRRPSIISLMSAVQIERFLRNGMSGRIGLDQATREERRFWARQEIEHFADVLDEEAIGVQMGVTIDNLPPIGFMMFRAPNRNTMVISPFRLGGEQPNVSTGVAMATSAPEALVLHDKVVQDAWRGAMKGAKAAAFLRDLVRREMQPATLGPEDVSKGKSKAALADAMPNLTRSRPKGVRRRPR